MPRTTLSATVDETVAAEEAFGENIAGVTAAALVFRVSPPVTSPVCASSGSRFT